MKLFDQILLTTMILVLALFSCREWQFHQRLRQRRGSITVYVTGAVAESRSISLPVGARRIHAINLCGGVLPEADLQAIEPARVLKDGETVFIARVEKTQQPHKPRKAQLDASSHKVRVSLNHATRQQLQAIPGIGPVMADRIIEYRGKSSFTSLEDLTAIRGIKRKTLARLRPYLELEGL